MNNYKKLIITQTSFAAWLTSFIVLFFLLFSTSSFAINTDGSLSEIIRDKCVNYSPDGNSSKISNELINQRDNAVKLALKNGADPRDIDQFSTTLPSLEVCNLLLNNGEKSLDASKLLALVVTVNSDNGNLQPEPEFVAKQKELVMFTLRQGADPNYLLNLSGIKSNTLLFNTKIWTLNIDLEILELLFNNDYNKLEPKLFCEYLKASESTRGKHSRYWFDFNGASHLLQDFPAALAQKYKNLNAEKALAPKIPRIIHHIWLTNSKKRNEITSADIETVIKNKQLFSKTGKNWEHIVWTNDKNLIPQSVSKLEANGVTVREISEIKTHLKMYETVNRLITLAQWGMASDTLRYDLVNYLGGVYADLGFVFTRDVEEDIHKYDFFHQSTGSGYWDLFENYFFASKANHPVLIETTRLVDENFKNTPEYIKNHISPTSITTYYPFHVAYYTGANKNGNVDVIYPYADTREDTGYSDDYYATEELRLQKRQDIINKYCESINSCHDLANFELDFFRLNKFWQENDQAKEEYRKYVIGTDKNGERLSWAKNGDDIANSEIFAK